MIENEAYLTEVISEFKNAGIRTSIFIDTDLSLIEGAAKTGTDRIELYTEQFAVDYASGNLDGVNFGIDYCFSIRFITSILFLFSKS